MTDRDLRIAALNFSWLEEGHVAGCRGPRSDEDLAFLRSLGVQALVRLASDQESGVTSADVERSGIRECYEPVQDWRAPSQEQIDRIIDFISGAVTNAEAVAVSCGAGYGRTGTVLACYIVWKGVPPEAAIEQLISARPCSREILRVPDQREAVFEFGRRKQTLKKHVSGA